MPDSSRTPSGRKRRPHSHELVTTRKGRRYRRDPATRRWVLVPESHECSCGKKRRLRPRSE